MRRLFWLSVGAAAGYYAARKGGEVVDQARERGLVGNVTLAATTATRLAATASRTTLAVGEAVGTRARTRPDGTAVGASDGARATAAPSTAATSSTREARP